MLPVTGPGGSVLSYKQPTALLGLDLCRKYHRVVDQVRFYQHQAWGKKGQLKPQSSQRPTFTCRIVLGLNSESTSRCTPQHLRYSCWWWYCFPWDWCLMEEHSSQERCILLGVWGTTDHRFPSRWPFISFHRGTSPRISLCDFSLLCPPCAKAQGRWLQMKFYALAL